MAGDSPVRSCGDRCHTRTIQRHRLRRRDTAGPRRARPHISAVTMIPGGSTGATGPDEAVVLADDPRGTIALTTGALEALAVHDVDSPVTSNDELPLLEGRDAPNL
jgi:hypothetical protein